MKHITLITTSYPQSGNGSEAAGMFVKDFSEVLSQKCQVSVVAPGEKLMSEVVDGTRIYRYWTPKGKALSALKMNNIFHMLYIFRVLASGLRAVYRLHKAESRIDFVFCFWIFPSGFWGFYLSKLRKIKYGTWALGSDVWSLGRIPILKQFIAKILNGAQINYADGFELADEVKSISGVECDFMASTRNIRVLGKEIKKSPPYVLGYLGRWHKNKGIDLLLKSLECLQECDWLLIKQVKIAGGGPMEAIVKVGVENLQNAHRPIDLQGYLNQQEAAEFFQTIDYFLLPSRVESIPVVFSDAIKNACPVITMPVGDMPKFIDKYCCGEMAKQINVDAYSDAIQKALREDVSHYLKQQDEIVSLFSIKRSVEGFVDAID